MKHIRCEDLISDLLTKPLTKEKTSKVLGLYYTCEPTYSHREGGYVRDKRITVYDCTSVENDCLLFFMES